MRNGIHRAKKTGRVAAVVFFLAAFLAIVSLYQPVRAQSRPAYPSAPPSSSYGGVYRSAYPEAMSPVPASASASNSVAPAPAPASSNPLDLNAYRYSEESWRNPLPTTRGIYEYPSESDGEAAGPRRPDLAPAGDVDVFPTLSSAKRDLEGADRIQASSLTILGYFGKGANEPAAQKNYDEGMEYYRQGKYGAAADEFSWAEYWAPEATSIKEESLFMEAESHFFAHEYAAAKKDYLGLLEWYDYSAHRDVAVNRLFRIAQYWERLDEETLLPSIALHIGDKRQPWINTFGATMGIYETIWLNDPRGKLADDSLMAAGVARMDRSRYEEAASDFENLRREHPDSEHLINACQMEIRCRTALYQGPEYDTAPLRDASRLVDQSIIQFGSELGENREEMMNLRSEIKEEEAKHEWLIAEYYDKKKYYGAARIYYQSIADQYADTSYGERASQRYAEIENLPDKPDKFAWIRWAIGPQKNDAYR